MMALSQSLELSLGVASATSNLWIIFLSGLSAILAGAFSMAGGEYVSVSTQKDTEEAAVSREQALLTRSKSCTRLSLCTIFKTANAKLLLKS